MGLSVLFVLFLSVGSLTAHREWELYELKHPSWLAEELEDDGGYIPDPVGQSFHGSKTRLTRNADNRIFSKRNAPVPPTHQSLDYPPPYDYPGKPQLNDETQDASRSRSFVDNRIFSFARTPSTVVPGTKKPPTQVTQTTGRMHNTTKLVIATTTPIYSTVDTSESSSSASPNGTMSPKSENASTAFPTRVTRKPIAGSTIKPLYSTPPHTIATNGNGATSRHNSTTTTMAMKPDYEYTHSPPTGTTSGALYYM